MRTEEREIKDSPIAWFYTLEDARRQNDFERAAEAQKQLKRLGVEVRYRNKKKAEKSHDRGKR